ncbi:MAG: TolC family protein [Treponema sp.]|nr:TolC family protein [Treponema sp.]
MKRAGFIFSLFLILNLGVNAQMISLEEARELALVNSRSLAKHQLAIQSSILDEKNQLYAMLPQISANYSVKMDYFKNWKFINPVDTLNAGAGLSITQVIFQGGKSFIQKAISSIATESVRKDALAEYFNVLDSVDNAYYAALEAAAALQSEEFSLHAAGLGLAIAEIRYQTGMINQGDYLRSLADKESRESSRNQAQRNLTISTIRFRNLLGITDAVIPQPVSFEAYEDVIQRLSAVSTGDAEALYNAFWKILAKENPSIAKANLSNQRAEKNHTMSKRDYAPTISATVFSADFNLYPGIGSSGNGGVTIRGTIPVDFWVLNNKLKKSQIALDSAAIDYANLEYSLEQELFNALSNIFAQAGTVLSSRRSLEYTEKHYEFVMERYRLSQGSVSDLNEATSLYITSQNNLNKASYSFLQSLSKLRSLCAMDDEQKLINLLLGTK